MLKVRQGFTLIELLIVVVIIGILAAIAIPKFSATREKAYIASMKSDLHNLASQQEIYYSNNNYDYTTDKAALPLAESQGVTVTITAANSTGWAATAFHEGLEGKSCVMYYGTNVTAPTTVEDSHTPESGGLPVCDDL